jgi:succinate-acetate transporter protein
MAIFCGGLVQLLAGMWEFAVGNTFGATGQFSIYSHRTSPRGVLVLAHFLPNPVFFFPRPTVGTPQP